MNILLLMGIGPVTVWSYMAFARISALPLESQMIMGKLFDLYNKMQLIIPPSQDRCEVRRQRT